MAALTNTRHEVFAQELAKGSSKAAAYEAAGYAPDTSNASKLTANHLVKRRIAELQQGAVESAKVTVASLVAAADEIRGLAIRDKQYSAAVGAVKEMGILTGLRVDRREVGSPGEFDRMSDKELMQLIEGEVINLIALPDEESR
jgi:phage terminase small subunit